MYVDTFAQPPPAGDVIVPGDIVGMTAAEAHTDAAGQWIAAFDPAALARLAAALRYAETLRHITAEAGLLRLIDHLDRFAAAVLDGDHCGR